MNLNPKQRRKGCYWKWQKDEDPVALLKTCNAHDTLMFFMQNGRVYVKRHMKFLKEQNFRGQKHNQFLEMQKDEKVAAIIAVDDFESEASLVLCTKKG